MSCWFDLMVFSEFYKQNVTWLRRHDALLGGLCLCGLTCSDDFGPLAVLLCIFVMRDAPEDGKNTKTFRVFRGDPDLWGTIKGGV